MSGTNVEWIDKGDAILPAPLTCRLLIWDDCLAVKLERVENPKSWVEKCNGKGGKGK